VLKVVNRHKTDSIRASIALPLTTASTIAPEAKVVTLNADAIDDANSLDAPERVRLQETILNNAGETFVYDFPAHSATIIELRGNAKP